MFTQLNTFEFFDAEPFLPDQVRFNIFYRIIGDPEPRVFYNGSTATIGQSNPATPVLIWTSPAISESELSELYTFVTDQYAGAEHLTFFAKPEVAQSLADALARAHGTRYKKITHMMAYECREINPRLRIDGRIARPKAEDCTTIAKFLADDIEEHSGAKTSAQEQLERAKELIDNADFYVWINGKSHLTTMAFITHRAQRHARINTVFTDRAERNKGYSAMLISQVCKVILADGLIPMLYTDYDYPASNRSYKKVGFVERGDLYSYLQEA